jgi:hypothetical protein
VSVPARGSSGGLEGLARAYLRRRNTILFYSLLFTLGGYPLLTVLGLPGFFIHLLLPVNLLAAVLSIESPSWQRFLLTVLVIGFAMRLFAVWFDQWVLLLVSFALWTVVALLTAASDLRFALRATSIDSEHVYAALSAYMLAGLFLGILYWVLEQIWPGSLVWTGGNAPEGFPVAAAIYFSFVTLATLGYGDVVPHGEVARGLAIIEAIAGQLYLAVMVARLVSLYVGSRATADKR